MKPEEIKAIIERASQDLATAMLAAASASATATEHIDVRWVTLERFEQLTGHSPASFYNRVQRGIFLEGVHFRREGRIYNVDMWAYNQWNPAASKDIIENLKRGRAKVSKSTGEASESGSSGAESAAESHSD